MRKEKKTFTALAAPPAATSPSEGGPATEAAEKEVDVSLANATATTHAVIRTEESADRVAQGCWTAIKRPPTATDLESRDPFCRLRLPLS